MERAMPWEMEAQRGQTGEMEPVAVGGESAWYVGERYYASADDAARVNLLHRQRAESDAARWARHEERQRVAA